MYSLAFSFTCGMTRRCRHAALQWPNILGRRLLDLVGVSFRFCNGGSFGIQRRIARPMEWVGDRREVLVGVELG